MALFHRDDSFRDRPTLPPIRDWFADELSAPADPTQSAHGRGSTSHILPLGRLSTLQPPHSPIDSNTFRPHSPHLTSPIDRLWSSPPTLEPLSGRSSRTPSFLNSALLVEPKSYNYHRYDHVSAGQHSFSTGSATPYVYRTASVGDPQYSTVGYPSNQSIYQMTPRSPFQVHHASYKPSVASTIATSSVQIQRDVTVSDPPTSPHPLPMQHPLRITTAMSPVMANDPADTYLDPMGAKYECQYCKKGFSRPSSLKIHLNSHTGEKPFVCPVGACGKSFSVLSNMRRHARMHAGATLESTTEEGGAASTAQPPSGLAPPGTSTHSFAVDSPSSRPRTEQMCDDDDRPSVNDVRRPAR